MSYKERKELETVPKAIESLEREQAELHRRLSQPGFYQQAGARMADVSARLAALDVELQTAYARWEKLEARAEGVEG